MGETVSQTNAEHTLQKLKIVAITARYRDYLYSVGSTESLGSTSGVSFIFSLKIIILNL